MSKCPIETCALQATSLGLCAGHFRLVSRPIQSEIYQLVKRHKGGPTHVAAIKRAMHSVQNTLDGWAKTHGTSAAARGAGWLPYRDD